MQHMRRVPQTGNKQQTCCAESASAATEGAGIEYPRDRRSFLRAARGDAEQLRAAAHVNSEVESSSGRAAASVSARASYSSTLPGDLKSLKVTAGSCGNMGDSLCRPWSVSGHMLVHCRRRR